MHSQLILAYFDPGAGSLLLQALVGGGAGFLVFARYAWNTWLSPIARQRAVSPVARQVEPVARRRAE